MARRVLSLALLSAVVWPTLVSRAAAPSGRYTIANETVYDKKTKLTWQRNGSGGHFTRAAAKDYCATLDLNGTGWRLPTVMELRTLVDPSRVQPAIDTDAFPGTSSWHFATSSDVIGNDTVYWVVDFSTGYSRGELYSNGVSPEARCVR